jgi:hypothetical protein
MLHFVAVSAFVSNYTLLAEVLVMATLPSLAKLPTVVMSPFKLKANLLSSAKSPFVANWLSLASLPSLAESLLESSPVFTGVIAGPADVVAMIHVHCGQHFFDLIAMALLPL